MPDVADPDFVGTLCEIWFAINYAAYHLAFVRVYLQTEALQTHRDQILKAEQAFRDTTQVEIVICRAHLAAFSGSWTTCSRPCELPSKRGRKNMET